jgi:hypothetical protein
MSAIYFHTEEQGQAALAGCERFYAMGLVNGLLALSLNLDDPDFDHRPHPVRRLLPPAHYTHAMKGREWNEAVRCALGISLDGDCPLAYRDDWRVSPFTAGLNTAMVAGSDPVRLLARLHGQCELHAYVRGTDRHWLARLIDQGVEEGILRTGSGWDNVAMLLRADDASTVVTSYSVTEQFPNPYICDAEGTWSPPEDPECEEGKDWDAWYDLSLRDRWKHGMAALRKSPNLQLDPETWATYRFGDGINGFQLSVYAAAAPRA